MLATTISPSPYSTSNIAPLMIVSTSAVAFEQFVVHLGDAVRREQPVAVGISHNVPQISRHLRWSSVSQWLEFLGGDAFGRS